jgi:hypothetical protein
MKKIKKCQLIEKIKWKKNIKNKIKTYHEEATIHEDSVWGNWKPSTAFSLVPKAEEPKGLKKLELFMLKKIIKKKT